ncbi:MAG: ankyrin repeat domain-containing protein, partial [Acidobacteriota bacterium]
MTRLTDLLRHRREPQALWQFHRFEDRAVRMWKITLRWKSIRIYTGAALDQLDLVEEHAFREPTAAAERCRQWRREKERAGWILVGADDPATGLRYWIRDPQQAWLPHAAHPSGGRLDDQLVLAAKLDRVDLVSAAIERGADVNYRRSTSGHTALELALASGYSEVAHALMTAGARLDPEPHPRRSALELAAELARAAAEGDLEGVDTALESGATAQPDDVPPLTLAAGQGDTDVVRRLLDAGADPRRPTEWPALEAAVEGGHLDVLRLLLDAGCRPADDQDRESPPLLLAAERGDLGIVDELLTAGADPDWPSEMGTPLEAAASAGAEAVYARLLPLTSSADVRRRAAQALPKGRRVRKRMMLADPRCHEAFQRICDADVEGLVALLDGGLPVDAVNEEGETLL